jgi:hypothetical protein
MRRWAGWIGLSLLLVAVGCWVRALGLGMTGLDGMSEPSTVCNDACKDSFLTMERHAGYWGYLAVIFFVAAIGSVVVLIRSRRQQLR